ncbi:MAG: cell wall-binding repeat-containing protein [Mycobacteriales bacterium]
MRTRTTLLALTAAGGLSVVAALAPGGTANAAQGFSLTAVASVNPTGPGRTSPNTLSPELAEVIRAQGSSTLENPRDGIGYYGYDSIDNVPPLLPTDVPEAHKTEPDKNTYLVLKGQSGPDAGYDYGTHFLFQGHESGTPGYVTRINLDADAAHRVTLLATQDQTRPLPDFDGSTYNPFTDKLMMTAESGCLSGTEDNLNSGVWQGNPSYAANSPRSSFESLAGVFGRGGYEGIQTASDGSIWLVEDIGGKGLGDNGKAKVPYSFVYRFVPTDRTDLSKGGKLQALQVSDASGPITYDAENPFTSGVRELHTYGTSFSTRWVTVNESGGSSDAPFCAGDLAKSQGATPFKRPENGVFRPGTGFGEFYFTETGDTNITSPANDSSKSTAGTQANPDNEYGGLGGVFRLVQDGPSADEGTLTLAFKGDLAHTGLDNIQFVTRDQVAIVEDAGDTLHTQRNALDSGYVFDVTQAQPLPLRFLAEGRDPSATIDSFSGGASAGGSNDGDNEITGIHVSDGDPSVDGLLGAKEPSLFKHGWRAFYTAQHGDNVTFEIIPNPVSGSPEPTTEPTTPPTAPAEPDVASPPVRAEGVTRLAGSDRFTTAAAMSRGSFPGTANDVFIMSGLNWPDALSAGPAAAKVSAPVLPVQTSAIPAAIGQEISRLQPRRAWVVGGASVVNDGVLADLRGRGIEVTRISGAGRYETAAAVANRFFPDSAGAYYASGAGYADALGGGAAAAKRGWPLLLTAKDSLPPATPTVGSERIVLGGPAAISDTVQAQLGARRVAGTDRFSTAAAIARDAFSSAVVGYLATGLNFPDALAGAPAAARDGAPLLLAATDCVTTATSDAFSALGVTSRIVLGGTAVVSDRAANLSTC